MQTQYLINFKAEKTIIYLQESIMIIVYEVYILDYWIKHTKGITYLN